MGFTGGYEGVATGFENVFFIVFLKGEFAFEHHDSFVDAVPVGSEDMTRGTGNEQFHASGGVLVENDAFGSGWIACIMLPFGGG